MIDCGMQFAVVIVPRTISATFACNNVIEEDQVFKAAWGLGQQSAEVADQQQWCWLHAQRKRSWSSKSKVCPQTCAGPCSRIVVWRVTKPLSGLAQPCAICWTDSQKATEMFWEWRHPISLKGPDSPNMRMSKTTKTLSHLLLIWKVAFVWDVSGAWLRLCAGKCLLLTNLTWML